MLRQESRRYFAYLPVALLFWQKALFAAFVFNPTDSSYEAINTTINNAYCQIFAQIDVSTTSVTLQIAPPSRSSTLTSLVGGGTTAHIDVTTSSITQTLSQIISAGSLSLPFTITAHPLSVTGYQLLFETLPVRVNMNVASTLFFLLQATSLTQAPSASGTTNILYHDLLYNGASLKRWIGFPAGTFLSPTWSNVAILQSTTGTSLASSITFTFSIGSSLLSALTPGTYWTNFLVAMLPPTEAIATAALTPQESATLTYLNNNIAADLTQTSLPAVSRPILLTNQAFLTKELAELN
ncbi:MAG: hypothetical protein JSR76_01905 [Verrucomicrobia bacterium]|nr:hypothetical protein [Verrucomicrobiota bacterium]